MLSAYEAAVMSFLTYEYVSSKKRNETSKKRSFDEREYNEYKYKKLFFSKDPMKFLFHNPMATGGSNGGFLNCILDYLSGRGWQLYLEPDELDELLGDYLGLAFINRKTCEIVIAHRGTVVGMSSDSISNYKDDIEILKGSKGSLPKILEFAIRFIVRVVRKRENDNREHYTMFQTGHSLGGFLAEFGAAYLANPSRSFPIIQEQEKDRRYSAFVRLRNSRIDDANAITFDSLGAGNVLKRTDINIPMGSAKTINYLPSPSIVNTANPHDGERRLLCSVTSQPISVSGSDHSSYVFLDQNILTNFEEVKKSIESHRLKDMMSAFNSNTGEPHVYKIITEWPKAINVFEESETMPERKRSRTVDDPFQDLLHVLGAGVVHAATNVVSFTHKREGKISYRDGLSVVATNTISEDSRSSFGLTSFNSLRQSVQGIESAVTNVESSSTKRQKTLNKR